MIFIPCFSCIHCEEVTCFQIVNVWTMSMRLLQKAGLAQVSQTILTAPAPKVGPIWYYIVLLLCASFRLGNINFQMRTPYAVRVVHVHRRTSRGAVDPPIRADRPYTTFIRAKDSTDNYRHFNSSLLFVSPWRGRVTNKLCSPFGQNSGWPPNWCWLVRLDLCPCAVSSMEYTAAEIRVCPCHLLCYASN